MANRMSNVVPQGNMKVLQDHKILQHGSPKKTHESKKQMKSNINKIANGTRTGDAVSDESETGDGEGDCSANEDGDHDSDEPDDYALLGGQRVGNNAISRLAGLTPPEDFEMFDDEQAVAGAERDDGNDSEDGYAAVDDISDSDEEADIDETTFLRSAEKDLIAEFEQSEKPRSTQAMTTGMGGMSLKEDAALARRLSLQSEDSQHEEIDYDLDFTQDPFAGLSTNDDLYQEMLEDAEGGFDNELASWRNPDADISRDNSIPSTSNQKKVRFEDANSRTSSMSSEDDPRDAYPDLFDGREDSSLKQQMILNGLNGNADNESVYDFDFEDENEKAAFDPDGESDTEDEMSDDDDSSDGDTTDEESEEEQMARVREIRRRNGKTAPANTPNSEPSTPAPGKRNVPVLRAKRHSARPGTSKNNGRPKMGTFAHDPTRAAVTADIQGSGVKLVCPTQPPEKDRAFWDRARQQMGSRDGSPGGSVSWTRATPRTQSFPKRPFTAKSTLGTMFDGNLDFLRNNDEHGIAKEFLMPARPLSMQSSFTSTTLSDDEMVIDPVNETFAELVQMPDDLDSEDIDEPPSAGILSPSQQDFFSEATWESSPMMQRQDTGSGLLDHFDQQRGLVSSFRNNQHFARQVSSLAAHPAKRAQTSEANALQKGRRAAANTPMTPARKKRVSQDLILTGAGVKKTASPLVQKHRRSRGNSLSQTLALDRFQDPGQ